MNFSRGHELWKKEGYRNGSGNFICDNYMYSKNNEYKNENNLRCVLYKKNFRYCLP